MSHLHRVSYLITSIAKYSNHTVSSSSSSSLSLVNIIVTLGSQDTSFGIVTGYWLDGQCLIHSRGKIFLYSSVQTNPGDHPPPIQRVLGALSQG
jgi:hypothetical protein